MKKNNGTFLARIKTLQEFKKMGCRIDVSRKKISHLRRNYVNMYAEHFEYLGKVMTLLKCDDYDGLYENVPYTVSFSENEFIRLGETKLIKLLYE